MTLRKYTLPNGLRVLHYLDKNTQMATVDIMYNVGAKVEHPEHTGFAHLFEHLMFAGSKHVPDYDKVVQNAAGENNAWTSPDVTNYYITLPAHHLETAFYLESDRMMALNINQQSLDVQRQVVLEEFKQRFLNQPYGDVSLLMRPLVYGSHPYAWPTIGKSLDHIEKFCLDDVRHFYQRYYIPNNAVISVCGNVDYEKTIEWIEKWFGDIPAGETSAHNIPLLDAQTQAQSLEVERDVPIDALYKYWHAPACPEKGYNECDLLTDILAGGNSARLIRALTKDKPVFSSIDIYVGGEGEKGAGSIQLCGNPADGIALKDAEQALQEELEKLAVEKVSEEELQKVKNKYESAFLFRNTNCQHMASQLCWYEHMGQAENYFEELGKTKAITAEAIQATAASIFRKENCSTLYYKALN